MKTEDTFKHRLSRMNREVLTNGRHLPSRKIFHMLGCAVVRDLSNEDHLAAARWESEDLKPVSKLTLDGLYKYFQNSCLNTPQWSLRFKSRKGLKPWWHCACRSKKT